MDTSGIALRTSNASDRIALRGVRVHARLAGMSQRTTVEQTFVNLEPRAIEAVYTFPLPEGAAVCAFEVITGDRVLTGVVEESDKAIEQYDDAIADGHGAFLMEQERPDVFTVRVGNLKPRQAATIRLTYVCALDRVDREIRVAFPTTVAPRYVTATATDPLEAAVDGDALNPAHALWVPYGLWMTVDVELGRELSDVYSPSHSIQVSRSDSRNGNGNGNGNGIGTRTTVTLAGGVTEMNRDVVLSLRLKKEHEPSVQVERRVGPTGEDEKYLAVTFVPELDEAELAEPVPVETVFVLDCSGSMQGASIAQATVALELCLRSLSAGDTFNICRFGSTFELMSSEPLAYSQATLDRAIQYVRQGADLGGTELHAPLEAIFKVPPRAGHVRQVILLTDGQVSNEPAVVALARKHRARNRVFTFGIGAASSAFLVKGIARATGGASEFISGGERIDEKVLRTFSRLASPVVSDVSIDWDGCDVQTLAELPPVFDGDAMTVFGRAPAGLPTQITLNCHTPAGPRRWTVPVAQPEDLGGVIPLMWARRTIQSMEEVNVVSRGRAAKHSREQEMLVSISKRFSLVCSLTSFIAVEHRSLEERNEGRPALRRVPTALAAGWGDVLGEVMAGGACGAAAPLCVDRSIMAAPAQAGGAVRRRLSGLFGGAKAKKSAAAPPFLGEMSRAFAPPSAPMEVDKDVSSTLDLTGKHDDAAMGAGGAAFASSPPEQRGLMDLLTSQRADGSFDGGGSFDPDSLKHLTRLVADWLGRSPSDELAATIAALVRLRSHHRDERDLWRRAERKAVRWLIGAVGRPQTEVDAFLDGLAADPQLASPASS
jgi:Ca-activated chloride channel family protein